MVIKLLKYMTFLALLPVLLCLSACSPGSYASNEGMMGAFTGTLLGSGVGWYLGDELGKKKENILLNAAIGGGLGLVGGALLNEQKVRLAKEREVVIREALLIDENQKELDNLREDLDESTNWGRGEVKPWNERYPDEAYDLPFSGQSLQASSIEFLYNARLPLPFCA